MTTKISYKSFIKGDYIDFIPEIYGLKEVVENNIWHFNQPVFDHVAQVLNGWELISSSKSDLIGRERIGQYLSKKNDSLTRDEMMRVMILYHDLGKKTVLTNFDKNNANPSHEFVSSVEWRQYSRKFDLSDIEERNITHLIFHHGLTHEMVSSILYYRFSIDSILKIITTLFGDSAIAMMMFCYSDVFGSHLDKHNSQEYKKRLEVIIKIIRKLISA